MAPSTATVSAKGWIVIPRELRRKYGLKPGTHVSVVDYAGTLSIVRIPEDPISAGLGIFAGKPSMTEELLAERRAERKREDER